MEGEEEIGEIGEEEEIEVGEMEILVEEKPKKQKKTNPLQLPDVNFELIMGWNDDEYNWDIYEIVNDGYSPNIADTGSMEELEADIARILEIHPDAEFNIIVRPISEQDVYMEALRMLERVRNGEMEKDIVEMWREIDPYLSDMDGYQRFLELVEPACLSADWALKFFKLFPQVKPYVKFTSGSLAQEKGYEIGFKTNKLQGADEIEVFWVRGTGIPDVIECLKRNEITIECGDEKTIKLEWNSDETVWLKTAQMHKETYEKDYDYEELNSMVTDELRSILMIKDIPMQGKKQEMIFAILEKQDESD